MSNYQTDEEQVEAIKKWWKENGVSVIAGAVLGLGIIGGWQIWQQRLQTAGESGSILYTNMQSHAEVGDIDRATELGKQLVGEYGGSAYGAYAALEMARIAYEKGEKSVAQGHLQWVMSNADDPVLAELGRLRLARLLLDMGLPDEASTVINGATGNGYEAGFHELRGDLARLKGDADTARSAYLAALEQGAADEGLLRMKLVDVGGEVPAS